MPPRLTAVALALLTLAACGGSSSGGCALAASLGGLGTLTDGTAALGGGDYGFDHPFNADARPDRLSVLLYAGYGAFTAGVAPGTFAIDATEAQYASCGLCVLLETDVDPSTGQAATTYLASGGTVDISQIDTRFVATLTGLTFRQVEINPSTGISTPVGTCASTIVSATIDSAVQ